MRKVFLDTNVILDYYLDRENSVMMLKLYSLWDIVKYVLYLFLL